MNSIVLYHTTYILMEKRDCLTPVELYKMVERAN